MHKIWIRHNCLLDWSKTMLKSYCNLQKINLNVRYAIWTRSKHDEIVDLMTKETCKEDKTPASKGLVVKPIVSKEFNSRGQMDLIDMQSLSYKDYRYIMVYQDHMTKCFVKRTPYKVMFGVEAKVGLTSSSLPDEIISKINTENDLKDSTNTGFRND